MLTRLRLFAIAPLLLTPLLLAAAPAPDGTRIVVTVTDLRNHKGIVRACLTAVPKGFPDCTKDPSAHTASVAVGDKGATLTFAGVQPGRYAISLLHDENSNGKADFALGLMPREGFGFSRDAKLRMGPPRFADAAFDVTERQPETVMAIRMRYLF